MRKFILAFFTALSFTAMPHIAMSYAESASGACLMNAVTGEIVFEKHGDEKMPMASTTKIITLLVALDKAADDEIVTVTENAAATEGSSAYIEAGDRLTMRDLEYGLMLNSGNDAAVAVAEHICGDTAEFAEMMNNLAGKLGAKNTHFDNPNGLDGETHYTTANDLARITRYAMKNERFAEIVSSTSYTAEITHSDGTRESMEYVNHNRLLREIDGCVGVKTGYTKSAGRCLVSTVKRDSAEYIAVTLNDADDWQEHKDMYEAAFSGCRISRLVKSGETIKYIKGEGGKCALKAADDFYIAVDGDKSRSIEVVTNLPDEFAQSLNAGEKVGQLDIYCDGTFVDSVDIVAAEDFICGDNPKLKRSFMYTLMSLIRNIL